MDYFWLLDPGHGGLVKGRYFTPGKRSPVLDDGRQLFEGEFNRAIADRIKASCAQEGLRCFDLVNTHFDISLNERVDLANFLHAQYSQDNPPRRCVYLSIHANAFVPAGQSLGFNNAQGWEVFTSKGETASDAMATQFLKAMEGEFPHARFRKDFSDDDPDKEVNFFVLRKTAMPAVLTENFFMTHRDEVELLLSEEGRDRIARAHFEAMKKIEALQL